MLVVSKKILSFTLILFALLLCEDANAGVLLRQGVQVNVQTPRISGSSTVRLSTAAPSSLNPSLSGGTYGTTQQLTKVLKARQKAYKKALKKYEKDLKKAEKIAKKKKAKQEKLAAKEAKKQEKLRKKLLAEQKKKQAKQVKESENSSNDDDVENSDSSTKVEGSGDGKEEGSFFSKLTGSYGKKFKGAGDEQNASGEKLDTSKLRWISRLFLKWFGTG